MPFLQRILFDDLFQMIQRRLGREGYRRDNFKRLGFDPIAEIVWNLLRFHSEERTTPQMPKTSAKSLQAFYSRTT